MNTPSIWNASTPASGMITTQGKSQSDHSSRMIAKLDHRLGIFDPYKLDQSVVEAESHGTRYKSRFEFNETGADTTEVSWEFEGKPVSAMARITLSGLLRMCGWMAPQVE